MNIGIVFQEFHLKCPKVRFGGISANWLRILWVVVYYFLIISFQSLLRARYYISVSRLSQFMTQAFQSYYPKLRDTVRITGSLGRKRG